MQPLPLLLTASFSPRHRLHCILHPSTFESQVISRTTHTSPCYCHLPVLGGFPGGSTGQESACSTGDLGSIPGLGRSPGGGNSYPLQYSGLENPWTIQSRGSQRVGSDGATFTFTSFHQCWDTEDFHFWLTATLFNSAPALILGSFTIPSDNHPKALASYFLSSHPPVLLSALRWPPRFSITLQSCH